MFECAATEKAHATAELNRGMGDVKREAIKQRFWIVFQVGTLLNPVILSRSASQIPAEFAPGFMPGKHPLNSTGKEQRGMNVCWTVAIGGVEQQVDEESVDDDAAYW